MAGLEDQELAAIRAARLNQLQQEGSLSPSLPTGEGSGGNGPGQGESQKAEEEMRRDVLATVLDSSARERLARIALVRPSLSKQIESLLVRLAQSGQLRGRVTEQQLIGLLEQAEGAQGKSAQKSTIVYQRRRELEDDDDEFDL